MTIDRAMAILGAALALALTGCLGTLRHERDAERVAQAAGTALELPAHDARPHWLLRQEPGWLGAHRVAFGGREMDRASTVVRTAVFADAAAASAALARLTPVYAHTLWPRRMREEPRVVAYPFAIPGDEVRTMEYPLRTAPEDDPGEELIVQLVALRTGRTVAVIESIGVPAEELPPVAAALVAAAQAQGGPTR